MDTLRVASPAGQAEAAWLTTVKVGDIRRGLLFPALHIGVEWVCTAVGADYWEFDGLFFGQPLCKVIIRQAGEVLTLEVKE